MSGVSGVPSSIWSLYLGCWLLHVNSVLSSGGWGLFPGGVRITVSHLVDPSLTERVQNTNPNNGSGKAGLYLNWTKTIISLLPLLWSLVPDYKEIFLTVNQTPSLPVFELFIGRPSWGGPDKTVEVPTIQE